MGRYRETQKEDSHVKIEAENGVMQTTAKECLEPPAQQGNEGSFPRAFGESMGLLTP